METLSLDATTRAKVELDPNLRGSDAESIDDQVGAYKEVKTPILAKERCGDWSDSQATADLLDDSTSVGDPSSDASSPNIAPLNGPSDSPDNGVFEPLLTDRTSANNGSAKDAQFEVCIVHHDEMQLHVPPNLDDVFEVPNRVIAIENCLKGLGIRGFPRRRSLFGEPMQFLPAHNEKSKPLVSAFGSFAKKRRRVSYSTGPPSADSVWDACCIVEAPLVKAADLLLVHSEDHIAKVTQACALAVNENAAYHPLQRPLRRRRSKVQHEVNDDIYYSPDSLASITRAAGGAVEAVRRLFRIDPDSGHAVGRSNARASFAIVRPPGHHCCDNPSGFCLFNNTAIAASHARAVLGLSRVAIVDWDYHHGDGTQKVFYRDSSVLTISLHVAIENDVIAFPGTRSMGLACNGLGLGRGYNINIPWPHNRVGAEEYSEAIRTIVLPALQGFNPELILVASGFDATAGDVLAGTRLPPRSYYDMTLQLLSLGKPIAVILEGGYSPEVLAEGSLNVVHALLGLSPPSLGKRKSTTSALVDDDTTLDRLNASHVLDAIRRRLNKLSPWSTMSSQNAACYFHEDPSPSALSASEAAAAKLDKIFEEHAE